jgi:hypothetical protein
VTGRSRRRTEVRIADELGLDPDYFGGGTFGLLAKKGAGKTYTGRVLAEELWEVGIPFVVLDPMGAWWGLRSSADGKGPGIPVAIFGGDHADAPLERGGGSLMADLVVDERLSMILDLKSFGSRAAEREFTHAFLERLYRRNRDLVHIFMDEADLFAPQRPAPGDQPLLGVTENIVRRGRNVGIGITLISQRAAVLNKDVLTQVDGLVAMRITAPTDRNAIDEWVKGHGDQEAAAAVKATLAGLANGECWWWIPELKILRQVQVRSSRTFDSSPTRTRGETRPAPKGFADVDLAAIEARITDTLARAKAEDPRELKRQVLELRRQVAELGRRKPPPAAPVEVPVIDAVQLDRLTGIVHQLRERTGELYSIGEQLTDAINRAHVRAGGARTAATAAEVTPRRPDVSDGPPAARRITAAATSARGAAPAQRPMLPTEDGFRPTLAQQRILDTLAWFEALGVEAPQRAALAPMAGSRSTSGGFKNNLGALRTGGLVDYPAGGRVTLTGDGRAAARLPDIPATAAELQAAVLAAVTPPQARLLKALISSYPGELLREDLAGAVGVPATSGGFKNNLGALRTLELIDYPRPGYVMALPILFPGFPSESH